MNNIEDKVDKIVSIAFLELPYTVCAKVISALVENVASQTSTEVEQQKSLWSIARICIGIDDPNILDGNRDIILTAIISKIRQEEPSNRVRLAATKALYYFIKFTNANFSNTEERNYIMRVLCEATQSPDPQICVAALQNLICIVALFYPYMEDYMNQALLNITMNAMKSEVDVVALQAIEFWLRIYYKEADLAIEAAAAAKAGRPPEQTSKHYAKGAVPYILPILSQILTKLSEFDDEDKRNLYIAALKCYVSLVICMF